MFVASHRSIVLDHLRVPYRMAEGAGADGLAALGFTSLLLDDNGSAPGSPGPHLHWPHAAGSLLAGVPAARHDLGGVPVFARAVDQQWLAGALPDGWRAAGEGAEGGTMWRHPDGSLLLSFDPGEALQNLWSERYLTVGARQGPTAVARWTYYRLRPLMPRSVQLALRRSYARVQGRREFPGWPVEPALHDFLRLFHGLLTEVAGAPVPWIAPWPRPYSWAVVLTHDVEQPPGQAQIGVMRDIERELGFVSSWNFPALRYTVDEGVVAALRAEGCEIGVHGALHDGRDLESPRTIQARLPAMRDAASRWGAEGFRSPATQRRWEWMPTLGFAYDSSSPDTDPYEPQPGGCCSWWPFFNGDMVELPITMPQDHTLFTILRADESAWLEKADALRRRWGMAVLLTHPDYLGSPATAAPYRRTLATLSDDQTAWRALPRDVAAWWRRRAASSVERDGDGWCVTGPAADEAAVCTDAP